MNKSKQLLKLLENVGMENPLSYPFKYPPEYKNDILLPIKKVSRDSVPECVNLLFDKYCFTRTTTDLYKLTSYRPRALNRLKISGKLLDECESYACYRYMNAFFVSSGNNIYGNSYNELALLYVSK